MIDFFQQVFLILTINPGSLAYNLVLAFSILAAFLTTLYQLRGNPAPEAASMVRRTLFGLSLLLVFRLTLFVAAGLAWQRVIDARIALPVLERSVDLLGLLVIVWLWSFPFRARAADLASAILAILTIALTVIGLANVAYLSLGQFFNDSLLDWYAQVAALGLVVLGIVLLLIRRPTGWPFGLVMLILLGTGPLVQLLAPVEGDLPGAVRLSQMVAYPLLVALPYRLTTTPVVEKPAIAGQAATIGVEPTGNIDLQVHHLIIEWASSGDPRQAGVQLAEAIAKIMQADICLFLWPPDSSRKFIARFGYDLVHQLAVPDLDLDSLALPVLTQAFAQARPLRLPGNSTAPDTRELARVLDIKRSGSVLAVPAIASDGQTMLGVCLLSPFSGRRWTGDDQGKLSELIQPLAQILQRNREIAEIQAELVQTRRDLQSAEDRVVKAENDRSNLTELVSILQQPTSNNGGADMVQNTEKLPSPSEGNVSE